MGNKFYIEILEVNRDENWAYVARSYSFKNSLEEDYATREDRWFNCNLDLDWLEKVCRCRFNEGEHPYTQITLREDMWKGVE